MIRFIETFKRLKCELKATELLLDHSGIIIRVKRSNTIAAMLGAFVKKLFREERT